MESLILQIWQLQQNQVASQGLLMGREDLTKSGLHKNGKKLVDVVLDLFGFFLIYSELSNCGGLKSLLFICGFCRA